MSQKTYATQQTTETKLTEKEETKAKLIFEWVKAEKVDVSLSREEIREMVHADKHTPKLNALFARRSALQKGISALCTAASNGDMRAAKSVLKEHTDVARMALSGRGAELVDAFTGVAPLQLAAGQGHEAMLQFLVDVLKLPVDMEDGRGLTAVEVAQQCNRANVVKLLHERGAKGPRAAAPPAPAIEVKRHSATKKTPKRTSRKAFAASNAKSSPPASASASAGWACVDYALVAGFASAATTLAVAIAMGSRR